MIYKFKRRTQDYMKGDIAALPDDPNTQALVSMGIVVPVPENLETKPEPAVLETKPEPVKKRGRPKKVSGNA